MVNTARTPLLPPPRRLSAGLSFTYALKRLPALALPLHAEKSAANASRRLRPPILSSHPPSAPNLFHDTPSIHRASIRQRCSNIQHTSSSTASPIHLPLSPWLPSRFSSLPRSSALLSLTITPPTVSAHYRTDSLQLCASQANVLCSRLCRPSHCDCHRDRVRHAWCACLHSSCDDLLRGASSTTRSSGHFG